MSTIAIVGGGIAGLSIAHDVRKRASDIEVVVLERGERACGNIRTERADGYTCECGPDGFLDNAPDTLKLVTELGLDGRIMASSDAARRRYIFRRGRLHAVPASPVAFLTSPLLSRKGRIRTVLEPFAAAPPDGDETIHGFASRHIGREAADVMIDSMVSGIYAGNTRELSLRACFPKMYEMEREYRSLIRALIASRRRGRGGAVGAPAGRLTSFQSGMAELIDTLAHSLGSVIRTSSPAVDLCPPAMGCYWLFTPTRRVVADAVVLAGPSSESAELVRRLDPGLSADLADIQTAPITVVCLGFDSGALEAQRGPLDGFGFLVPRSEGIRTLGVLWESSIYANRAPEGRALMRVMIGGAHDPGAVDLDDEELMTVVRADLFATMGLSVAPVFTRIFRHRRGIPQYTTGHLDRLQRIDAALERHDGLFVAGNSYRGVSINSCVAEAPAIAERVVASVRARARYSRASALPRSAAAS